MTAHYVTHGPKNLPHTRPTGGSHSTHRVKILVDTPCAGKLCGAKHKINSVEQQIRVESTQHIDVILRLTATITIRVIVNVLNFHTQFTFISLPLFAESLCVQIFTDTQWRMRHSLLTGIGERVPTQQNGTETACKWSTTLQK